MHLRCGVGHRVSYNYAKRFSCSRSTKDMALLRCEQRKGIIRPTIPESRANTSRKERE